MSFQVPGNMNYHGEGAQPFDSRNFIRWSNIPLLRILPNGDHGSLCTSRFPLPNLRPPRSGIVALLELPSSAKLHVPAHARLTLRNFHPSRTASLAVQLEPDTTDAFLVAGQCSARVPTLLPSAEAQLVWSLVPIECGFVRVPKISVVDRRNAGSISSTEQQPPAAEDEGILVRVVDLRRDEKVEVADATVEDTSAVVDGGDIGPILVLP
jgi:trafficking protein particle complex subunit 11